MASDHNSVLDAVPVVDRPQIEMLVEDILQSGPFRTSRQCQDLFRYVVEHSLIGSDDSLRERVIGIEVFGRSPDYDTAEDPVVRLRAADVRKRLAQYYLARGSEPGGWKIDVPTGSYRAQFHSPEISAASPLAAAPAMVSPPVPVLLSSEPSVAPAAPNRKKAFWLFASFGVCLAIALGGFLTRGGARYSTAPIDQFWAPVLESPGPVLICSGSNRVFRLSAEAESRYRKNHPNPEGATPNFELLVPRTDLKGLTGQDFIPVNDTYLTVGDASATAQLAAFFTSHGHPFDLRFGSDLSFGDLREGSAVLIGAFNNSWTLNMTDSLRFVFDGADTGQMHVRDRFDASRSWWPKVSNGKFTEDYAIVSRVLNSKSGRVVITIAGLDHTGTRAAGDFVSNPGLMAEFAKQAPRDWNKKNLQLVLHTNVLNDVPGPPTIIAAYLW